MYKYKIHNADILVYTEKRMQDDRYMQYFSNVLGRDGFIIEPTHYKSSVSVQSEALRCAAKVVIVCGSGAIKDNWHTPGDVDSKYAIGCVRKVSDYLYLVACVHPMLLSAQTESQKFLAYSQMYDCAKTARAILLGQYNECDFSMIEPVYEYGNAGHIKMLREHTGPLDIDTEDDAYRNCYSVQICYAPRHVLYFEGNSLSLLRELHLNSICLHNAKHDIPRLRQVGLSWDELLDTMQFAYNIGEPLKGLKHLARKHCNMVLTPYTQVVTNIKAGSQVKWLQHLAAHDLPVQPKIRVFEKTHLKEKQPTQLNKRLLKFIKDIDAGKVDDIGEAWKTRFLKTAKRQSSLPYPSTTSSTILLDILDNFEEFPAASLNDVDEDKKLQYACQDADATNALRTYYQNSHANHHNVEANKIDEALLPYVVEMEKNGLLIDIEKLRNLRTKYERDAYKLFYTIQHWFWDNLYLDEDKGYFNPSSNDQSKWLISLLGIEAESASAKHTKRFRKDHDILQHCADYKALRKIVSTYIDAILENADSEGYMHGHFNTTVAKTGRFSASDPINWQNIASHSQLGQELRSCVIVPKDYIFVSIDYSQIEIRVLCKESGDATLYKLFQQKVDVHSNTRDMAYGKTGDKQTDKENRTKSKKTLFGTVYGQSGRGVAENLRAEGIAMTDEEGEQLVQAITRRIYPGVGQYMDTQADSLSYQPFVLDMFGRRRDLPEVYSPFYGDKQSAKRKAFNTPIQSGATGMIKRAMLIVWKYLTANKLLDVCRPVLMIHDELDFYIHKDRFVEIVSTIKALMEGTPLQSANGDIPVVCDVELSDTNWNDCVEVDWAKFKEHYDGSINSTIVKIRE